MHLRFGIGLRLLVMFFVCFMLMAALGLLLLRRDLIPGFQRMEQVEASADAERLVNSFDAALDYFQAQVQGWANWDDLYLYALNANPAFKQSNLSNGSLLNADFTLVQIFDSSGQLIAMRIVNVPIEHDFDLGVVGHSRSALLLPSTNRLSKKQSCGFASSSLGLLMVCRQPIFPTNSSGSSAGTLVVGRVVDRALLQQIRVQTALEYEWLDRPSSIKAYAVLDLVSKPVYMLGRQLVVRTQAQHIVLDYPVLDLLERPVAGIRLTLPRGLMAQGKHLLWRTTIQLGLIAAFTGLLLLLSVQMLFVRPLARLQRSVSEIRTSRAWASRLRAAGRDEISQLGQEINGLLGVIDSQVHDLEVLSMTDFLTSLPNRRAFDVQLAQELSRVKRTGQPLSLLLLDIDYFKQYNDYYGHPGGDQALQALGEVVAYVARRGVDMGARLGGEEFAILLPNTEEAGAREVATLLQAKLAERAIPHARSEVSPLLTLSIGAATCTDGDESPTSFIHRADEALYKAKHNGRNRVESA